MLNSQYELIECVEPFPGTLTQASVYPREVVKMGLKTNAAAVVIAHNHPTGKLEPGEADKQLTRHLCEALQMVDVRLLDHILVAGNQALSFAERRLSQVVKWGWRSCCPRSAAGKSRDERPKHWKVCMLERTKTQTTKRSR